MSKFIAIWNVIWIVACPVAAYVAFGYGRKWKAKVYVKGLMRHLRGER